MRRFLWTRGTPVAAAAILAALVAARTDVASLTALYLRALEEFLTPLGITQSAIAALEPLTHG